MPNLVNTVEALGTVDGVNTGLTGAVTTQLINGLTLAKTADKLSWADGVLTYTITITNAADNPTYTAVQLTDVLDSAITFFPDSVTIGGSPALATDYNYDSGSNTLTIGIDNENPINVAAGASIDVTFQVQKA